jgi:uncharacterized protein YbjT (DUF2867 family)
MNKILVVGATGMLGSRIAHYLLEQPGAQVRLLVRPDTDAGKKNALKPLVERGAEVVMGDLADRDSLDRATQGIDVIVSSVQGGPDVIIAGQVALAKAGKRNGVRRILPSDFALDLFKATPGEHMMFDLRRTASEAIAATELEQVHVLPGGFMNLFLPGSGAIDLDAGTVTSWGDGTQPTEVTSVEDTARMVARVGLDSSVGSGKFAFAGDRISFLEAAKVIEAQTGRTLTHHSLGSETDLRAAKAKAEQDSSNPYQAVMLAYQLYMLNGQTALSDLKNDHYPDVKLETFAEFAAHMLPNTKS